MFKSFRVIIFLVYCCFEKFFVKVFGWGWGLGVGVWRFLGGDVGLGVYDYRVLELEWIVDGFLV